MVEDLSLFFTDFAEDVVVASVATRAIFNTSNELALGEVIVVAPTLQLPASAVPAVAEGSACVVRGLNYRVRQVLDDGPDGALRVLVLARV